MKEIKCEVIDDYGIVEEHPSNSRGIMLRNVSWGGRKPKVEIREVNLETKDNYKGIGLYSLKGVENLTVALIESGLVDLDVISKAVDRARANQSKPKEAIVVKELDIPTIDDDELTNY